MKTTTRTALLSLLIAGFFASATAGAAPLGVSTQSIQPGETQAQVQSVLGKPDRVMHFGSETVWNYNRMAGLAGDNPVLQVSFNNSGTVSSVNVHDVGSD